MAEPSVQNQSQPRRGARPNHGRRRPHGRGGKGGARSTPVSTHAASSSSAPNANTATENGDNEQGEPAVQTQMDPQQDESQEQDLCWICAEDIKYYAVSECNHRTCHVCALRLRALYKKLDCTFCKERQPTVIFTVSPDAPFSSYTPENTPFKDEKLAISFETEMMQDTLVLLRFNCPDSSCDHMATGWNDLKLHVRGVHKKFMCDLCISHKKVFPHEHALYTSPQYFIHLPSAQRRQQKSGPKEQVEGGIHPLCEFCHECLFGDEELYNHMRHSHEECFICKRNEIRDKYFKNYDALELHFERQHHPCPNSTCQARKFVVFGSQIDLQAHMVEEHGAEMSSRDKRDARRVNAAFEFQDAPSSSGRRRGGGADGGGSGGGGRERGQRDSQPQIAPRPTLGSESRHSLIGARLTEGDANDSSPEPSRQQANSPLPQSMDPVTAERYTAVFARLRTLTEHPTNAVAGVKLALRDYAGSQSGARDLISTVWNTLDCNIDATASIIDLVVDFLENEEKKTDLLNAWNTFKNERRRDLPPDLITLPTTAGTDYARITNGRAVSATSAHRAAPPRQTQRAVWDRVAQAAERGATFPPLRAPPRRQQQQPRSHSTTPAQAPPQPANTGQTPGVRKRGVRKTAWSASAASVGTGGTGDGSNGSNNTNAVPKTSQGGKPPPAPPPPAPSLTNAAFPILPSSVAPRAPPVVSARTGQLQHILGSMPPATSAWGPGRAQDEVVGEGEVETAVPEEAVAGGKKRGKGKQKQTLLVFGSYPITGASRQD